MWVLWSIFSASSPLLSLDVCRSQPSAIIVEWLQWWTTGWMARVWFLVRVRDFFFFSAASTLALEPNQPPA
jgi:hypothetical protein